jgi:hypothetical protein
MKESHVEGVANHDDPEPCVDVREGGGEASAGVRAGRVLSREITRLWGADAVNPGGRQHGPCREREAWAGPARSETPRTRGNFLRENREVPRLPAEMVRRDASGRPESVRRW